MYAVVGCSECSALWVLEGRPDTTQCPRCGHRRGYEKRRKFVTTDDEDHAREVRSSMLANRQGEGDAFADLADFETLGEEAMAAGMDDEEYLDRTGIDAESVAAAGERAEGGGGSRSRDEVLRDAIRDLDEPTESAVLDYATEHGVPADWTRDALERLVRSGEATESRGVYRLL